MKNFDVTEAIEILRRTPAAISAILGNGLSADWITPNEGPNTWSPFDIVAHLIYGEKTDWIPRVKIILHADNKVFTPFDMNAHFEDSRGKTIEILLDEFVHLRAGNLSELSSLTIQEDQLSLTGIHPEFGPVTLEEHLAAWVVHDLGHIAQISRVMAKRYKQDVGPWTAYMSVLNR